MCTRLADDEEEEKKSEGLLGGSSFEAPLYLL